MFLVLSEPPSIVMNFTEFILGTNPTDFDDDDDESSDDEDHRVGLEQLESDVVEPIQPNCMDAICVAKNNLDFTNVSNRWKQDFSKRPTWFDAGLALQQILWGNAVGFRAPLYSRVLIQSALFRAGCFVQRYAWFIIVSLLTLFTFCSIGLRKVHIETDIVKLWVSEGGRLDDELHFLEDLQKQYWTNHRPDKAYEALHFFPDDPDPRLSQIPEDEAPTLAYQVLIQTADPNTPGQNVLTRRELLRHVDLVEEITRIRVNKFGFDWEFSDLCFKPGQLDIENDSLAYSLKPTLERLIPCIWISPIDCFFEGAKPLGPSPPIQTDNIPFGPMLHLLIPDIPAQASWMNIDPSRILEQVTNGFSLGTIQNFFTRSGIGHGYLHRPCIDPLDPKCPKSAPNYFSSACDALKHMESVLMARRNQTLDQFLAPYKQDQEEKRLEEEKPKKKTSAFDILGALFASRSSPSKLQKPKDNQTEEEREQDKCEQYRDPFLRWMSANWEEAQKELPAQLLPTFPDYGQVMQDGCNGVARNVMNWPADMILGGIKRNTSTPNGQGSNVQAEALQSVFLVATPTEVFRRFKENSAKFASNASFLDDGWSPLAAREVIQEWARTFTNQLYNHGLNRDQRLVHPLASNSISDMLAEYCNFNYVVILIGYLLMLVYALYSQCRFDGCCSLGVESAVGLALAGVLTVTLSGIAGLGISTWFGINFNAATTQIVPFLALGIGVDNIFLLLHNYPQVVSKVRRDELGFLLKETGMSILTTSLNNILAFWAGTILPIPALRSFCGQTAILLTTNLVGIFFIYPAFIALDLKRRKAGRRDMAFLAYYCLCLDTSVGTVPEDERGGAKGNRLEDEESLYAPAARVLAASKHKGPEIVLSQSKPMATAARGNGENGRRGSGRRRRRTSHSEYKWYTLQGLLHIVYIPLLKHKSAKISMIVFVACLFSVSIYGICHSSIGLELSDVLPENSAPEAFLKTRDRFFSFYPMSIVLQGEHIDFPAQQHNIDLLRNEIGRSSYVIKLPDGEPSERYWLQLFREWLLGMQQRLDQAQSKGLLEHFDSPVNGTAAESPDLQIAYSLACSYGQNYDCGRAGRVRLIDESGTINREAFYNYLYGWHEYEQMFYAVSQASFYPRLKKLRQGPPGPMKYRYFIPPAPKPLFSRIPFYLTGLSDTPTIVRMIHQIRAISENYSALGLNNYPEGVAFTFWEQYLHLDYYLALAISIISLCVFFVISLIFFNPWAAAMVSLTVLSMTVELAGFMGWAGVKLNPISAVTLITAVGIGVEFTAHIVIAFLTSLGTRHERMDQCLEHMFVPVIHGGMSTLLGIVMLAFSEFDFVFKYFFVVMSALVIIGMFNGLVLLPVLLSLIGPPCEIRPVGSGRKDRLKCPSFGGSQRSQQQRAVQQQQQEKQPRASPVRTQ